MSIFPRRILQRLIDQVAPLQSVPKTRDQIRRLEIGGADGISTAWELAITATLSGAGHIEIEPSLDGNTRVDFAFQLEDSSWKCIGDVVAVFDSGMHEASGREELEAIVWRLIQMERLNRLHFHIWLEGDIEGTPRRRRARLKGVKDKTKRPILENLITAFLRSVHHNLAQPLGIDLRKDGFGCQIGDDPKWNAGDTSGSMVEAPYGVESNPLMNALKRKATQLRNTAFCGPRIVICCDGGAYSLRARRNYAWSTPTASDIVSEFLRQNTSITGVIVVAMVPTQGPCLGISFSRNSPYKCFHFPGAMATPKDASTLTFITQHLAAELPPVVRDPRSFLKPWQRDPDTMYFRHMGFKAMSPPNRIQVPLRALQELLAGTLSQKDFLERFLFRTSADGSRQTNLFELWSRSGHLIRATRVVHDRDSDDDWIEFEFGEMDPAVSAFQSTPGTAGQGN